MVCHCVQLDTCSCRNEMQGQSIRVWTSNVTPSDTRDVRRGDTDMHDSDKTKVRYR